MSRLRFKDGHAPDSPVAAVPSLAEAVIGTEVFPATAAGYRERPEWRGQAPSGRPCPHNLLAQGVEVFDVNRPDCPRRGKSDPPDAQNAAREAESGDGPVRSARLYKLA
ncbi:hypothetical protein GCM10009864_80680 [Streptomyces lunalinharesii]|uniref:Transposase n=1 Tax=Streptomyces lunalinharesii TaxID=333384 RepID=A0ABN3T5R6_9ACTN